jgi:hypothetical protein
MLSTKTIRRVEVMRLSRVSPNDLAKKWEPSPAEEAHYAALLKGVAAVGPAPSTEEATSSGFVSPMLQTSGAGATPQPPQGTTAGPNVFHIADLEKYLMKSLGLTAESARGCVQLVMGADPHPISSADAERALRAAALCQAGILPTPQNFVKYMLCVMPNEPTVEGLTEVKMPAERATKPLPRLHDRVLLLFAEVPRYMELFDSLRGSSSTLQLEDAFKTVCNAYFASRIDEAQFDALHECFQGALAGHAIPAQVDAAQFAFLCNAAQFMALGLDASDVANRKLLKGALRRIRTKVEGSGLSSSPRSASPTSSSRAEEQAAEEEGVAAVLTESTSGTTEKAAAHYRRLFDECSYEHEGNHVSQDDFAAFFVGNLGLPIEPVRYCFHLSDLDGDNFLDLAEYAIAHHLMLEWLKGHKMPSVVPSQIVPLSKQKVANLRELPLRRVKRVFISYRWDTPNAKGWSVLVRDALLHLDYEFVFLDIDMLSGSAGETVAAKIATCDALVPLWTKGCYDRCLGPSGATDAVRIEVETALENKLIIVPVIDAGTDGFNSSGYSDKLPPSMMPVLGYDGSMYVHEYPEVWIRKLHRLLQGW